VTARAFTAVLALVASTATAKPPLASAHYVAMGSSFAAGPGITRSADTPPTRCNRSADNYARQLAARYRLDLTDVSCGGATTAHILGPWNELPPQISALRSDTALVTVTIGGNDVGYVAGLFAGSCEGPEASASAPCRGLAQRAAAQGRPNSPASDSWKQVETGMASIAATVRARSPRAALVFVDYLSALPPRGLCAAVPLSPAAERRARETAKRLAAITARIAARSGALLVRASRLSEKHSACAGEAWMNGFTPPSGTVGFAPYHPNRAGMTAIANAIARRLEQRR
jgi:lysophospholipase L1-like esterase